ncbi:unnamed protein product [Ceratitis capitata]|uniref:(Mediterranean fruit fly) hypothetical protein n=1 Tax=Ceratitis capitata TaxID=7213 RepID=A0A811UKP3_CERCA|nr:unnamed protein product [Ceratitis capitata]
MELMADAILHSDVAAAHEVQRIFYYKSWRNFVVEIRIKSTLLECAITKQFSVSFSSLNTKHEELNVSFLFLVTVFQFVVAVVMLALATGAHSSLLGAQISPGVSYINPTLAGPLLGLGGWAAPAVLGGPAAVTAWGGIAPGLLGGIPAFRSVKDLLVPPLLRLLFRQLLLHLLRHSALVLVSMWRRLVVLSTPLLWLVT